MRCRPSNTRLGIVTGGDFFALKGIVESLLERMGIQDPMSVSSVSRDGVAAGTAVELKLGKAVIGYLGVVAPKVLKGWKLPESVIAAELSLPVLLEAAQLVPQQQAVSPFPSVQRDLNFIVAESVRWSDMDHVVRAAVGGDLADLSYCGNVSGRAEGWQGPQTRFDVRRTSASRFDAQRRPGRRVDWQSHRCLQREAERRTAVLTQRGCDFL